VPESQQTLQLRGGERNARFGATTEARDLLLGRIGQLDGRKLCFGLLDPGDCLEPFAQAIAVQPESAEKQED
jgi:hypothetical protein